MAMGMDVRQLLMIVSQDAADCLMENGYSRQDGSVAVDTSG